MTDEMKSIDRATEIFREKAKIAKNMLLKNIQPIDIAEITGIPLYWVRDLQKEIEQAED